MEKKTIKIITWIVIIFLMSSALSNTVQSTPELVFTVGTLTKLELNPLTGFQYFLYKSVLYTTLFAYNATYGLEPWLAEYAKRVDDLTWEIKIRDNAYWHDGVPVKSEDFNFTWNLALKYSCGMTRFLQGIKDIEVISDKVFRVHLQYPMGGYAPFLGGLTEPVPEHIWKPKGLTNESALAYNNVPPIGCGPFKFVDFKPDQYLVCEAFDKFFAGRPKIDRLIIRQFDSVESMISALKAGEIDAVDLVPTPTIAEMTQVTGLVVHTSLTPGYISLYVNQYPQPKSGNPALDNLIVRKAIAMCIDRDTINSIVHPTYGKTYGAPIPPFWPEFDPKLKEIYYNYNTTTASELLENAGYRDTDGDGIREDPITHQPLKFRLYVYSGFPDEMRAADFIRDGFRSAGMDLEEIKAMEGGALWSLLVSPPHDWDLAIWDWGVHDAISCWYPYTSDAIPAGWSSSGYHNSEFDKLYTSLLQVKNYSEFLTIEYALQEHFVQNVVELPLYLKAYTGVWRSDWVNITEEPGHLTWEGHNAKALVYAYKIVPPIPSEWPWKWPLIGISVVSVAVAIGAVVWALKRRK
jgi:peptide/nickel transport system substrate-binding protein